ncbi:Glucose--fructose oxidoreductase precursor [Posidoniimonas polymericola]|uniref:Glucose--fructose oxidoreductase n=1 Tax=Posidoniimonas polymericola TaxID=2528002 RepID=A0A5C5YKY7_9BACT|nr:Gfo/Idh/MocA family oxidoreductase [Posidoniimonas polymericola]TWT75583.1 Glucose--fructose oxidoreductase precursor [Posidoniimonas polymericola]
MRIGVAGIGFMGMVHYLSYQGIEGAEVAAICDPNPRRRAGDWTGIKGNFGPAGEQMDLTGVAAFESLDDLITCPEVDLVDLCLPPSLHADAAVAALEGGKHVFCEKPMAMTAAECDRMLAAAEANDRRLLIGHVLPFFPEYAWALEAIESGRHGRVVGGSFRRVISDPAWLQHYWDAAKVGGPMLDLHIHDAHFIRKAFGMPTGVTARGSLREGLAEHWHSLLEFAQPGLTTHVEGGVLNQAGRPFLHGFEIQLERATLMFEFAVTTTADGDQAGYTCPPTILEESGVATRIELGDGDPMHAFRRELQRVVEAVGQGADAGPLACELARDAIVICDLQSASLRASLQQ